ncbi:hypothetical protein [Chryseobacterium sp. SIMBA_038]|uniref:hypothetical protein n=1 Tax=Chryseobacterium sp. SIMBA_038 TaxID=3085780 RepID=UPI003979EC80
MKKNIIFYLLLVSNIIFGQDSPYKGFLPPRLSTIQRDAITSPPPGLMIYNTTINCMENWNASRWVSKCSGIVSLNCLDATHNGTLTSGTAASGVSSVISYTGGNGGSHSGQVVTSTGVTGLTATLLAGNFANGNGTLTYTITGTPSSAGTASFAINIGGQTCILTRTVTEPAGAITTLDCAGATNNGTLTSGTIASGVSSVISYTGGNGGSHSGQIVTSTGVTGLTATLSAGNFANGNGTLTYTITGTPSSAGTASFAINIGGQTCNITRAVIASAGAITTLDCAGASNNGSLLEGVAVSNIFSIISYTGGNGGSYPGQIVTSTGVTGLTATLLAGNFANGNGTLIYTITGTPSSAGTASFTINIGGQNCILTRIVSEYEIYNCQGQPGRFALQNPHKYVVCASCQRSPGAPNCVGVPIDTVVPTYFTCPNGTVWKQSLQQCAYP